MTPPEDRSSARIRVAVLYGGRSTEHEISLLSAASVVANLDRSRYEVSLIEVDKAGAFHRHALPELSPGRGVPVLPVSAPGNTGLALAAREGSLFAGELAAARSPVAGCHAPPRPPLQAATRALSQAENPNDA
jgi:D-alanine-D-alanine ligase-like ATP-grasp enzyme